VAQKALIRSARRFFRLMILYNHYYKLLLLWILEGRASPPGPADGLSRETARVAGRTRMRAAPDGQGLSGASFCLDRTDPV